MVGFSESWKDYRCVEVQLLLLVFPSRFPCSVKGSIVGRQERFPPITQFPVNGQWVRGANIIGELHASASVVPYLRKCGNLRFREILVITVTVHPTDRPSVRNVE